MPIRPINTSPASYNSFDLTKSWLRTCLDTHQMCPKPNTTFMSTRLIEISCFRGHLYLRLLENGHERLIEPYAVLSYCWGKAQNVTTRSDTIGGHLTGINLKTLGRLSKMLSWSQKSLISDFYGSILCVSCKTIALKGHSKSHSCHWFIHKEL